MSSYFDSINVSSLLGDPVLQLLGNKLHFSKKHCFLILLLGNLLWLLCGDVLVWLHRSGGQLFTFNLKITIGFYLSDPLIGTPLLIIGYIWSADSFDLLLQGLIADQLVKVRAGYRNLDLSDFLRFRQRNLERQTWLLPTVALLASLCYWLYKLMWNAPSSSSLSLPYAYWYGEKWYFWLVYFPRRTFTIYMVSVLTIRYLSTSQHIKHLLELDIVRVSPLHPDRVGGFGAVTRYIRQSVLMVVILGLGVSVYSWYLLFIGTNPWPDPRVYVGLGLYSTLLPLLWFYVISPAHERMLVEKRNLIRPLALIFQTIFENVSDDNVEKSLFSHSLEMANYRLSEIRRSYDLIDATFPIWPIETSLFRGLSIATFLPYITSGASLLIRVIKP